MRLWSEEQKQGTIETLLTLPISDTQVVLAKFSAAASFVAIVLLCSLPLPITLSQLGNLDWGPVLGSYLGAWLLGASYIALGQWISSLTNNQIVAFLVTTTIAFVLLLIGLPSFVSGSSAIAKLLFTLSTVTHFENLSKGVIDLRDIVYYLSFIGLFLYLNVYSLAKRHWS
jgi:ABC-2 type transport system permease protein